MMNLFGGNAAKAGPTADPVKDTTTQGFMADVIEASMTVPVLVDFWAPWCGPCKQLTPVLEKVVRAAKGKVRLVKLNTDQYPEIPQQMRVSSIPAVFAFVGGRPVDGFVGALPESQIKSFIDKLMERAKGAGPGAADPLDAALKQAGAALTAQDYGTAGALFTRVLEVEPENGEALAGLARCLIASGRREDARAMLKELPAELAADKHIAIAKAALELADMGGDPAQIGPLTARLSAEPGDHQARFDLALALLAANRREEAVDALLELFRRARSWNDEAARKQLVKLFEAFGPTDPLTVSGRKRLSSLMFA